VQKKFKDGDNAEIDPLPLQLEGQRHLHPMCDVGEIWFYRSLLDCTLPKK
jgi:hypothetical protein